MSLFVDCIGLMCSENRLVEEAQVQYNTVDWHRQAARVDSY
jgi:hypothetical protein